MPWDWFSWIDCVAKSSLWSLTVQCSSDREEQDSCFVCGIMAVRQRDLNSMTRDHYRFPIMPGRLHNSGAEPYPRCPHRLHRKRSAARLFGKTRMLGSWRLSSRDPWIFIEDEPQCDLIRRTVEHCLNSNKIPPCGFLPIIVICSRGSKSVCLYRNPRKKYHKTVTNWGDPHRYYGYAVTSHNWISSRS